MRATEGRRFAEEGGEQYQKTTKTQARPPLAIVCACTFPGTRCPLKLSFTANANQSNESIIPVHASPGGPLRVYKPSSVDSWSFGLGLARVR